MSDFLNNRRVVVTGGGRGIGRAIALEFGRLGAKVNVISKSENALRTATEISDAGGWAQGHVGSVADESFAKAVLERVAAEQGPAEIVVNAAAIVGPWGPFRNCSMSALNEVLQINLLGTCNFMRWSLRPMEEMGFGRIINFSGGGGAYSNPMFSPYGVSKAALVRLTETVADEIDGSGVTVNIVAPGGVDTDMLAEIRSHDGPVRAVVDIGEPVNLTVFLAGETAAHITGRFIHVRDDYRNPDLYATRDLLKLRRLDNR